MDSLRKDRSPPKGILRYSTRPPKDPEFEMFRMAKTSNEAQAVVIAIKETSPSSLNISTPPKAHLPRLQTSSPTPNHGSVERSITAKASNDQRPMTPPNPLPPPPPRSRTATPAKEPSLHSHASSTTLIRGDGDTSTSSQSPVMRSMFPRYDPMISLAKQHYYPDVENNPRLVAAQLDVPRSSSFGTSVHAQQGNASPNFSRPSSAPQAVHDPVNSLSRRGSEDLRPVPTLSTPEELLDLWSIANGQASQEAADTYILGLNCPDLTRDREVITFTSSKSQVLYMLDAANENLTISRSHPINPTTTIQISSLPLSEPSSNNPLMTTIFPKLSELMALDQSSSIAVDHRLDRQTSADLQAEAITRAFNQEASSLFWDTDSQKYYLIHPTLSSGSPATFPIESNQDQITISAPNNPNPILRLSLKSLTLTLHAHSITNLSSLYILDTLLTALLCLLLHLHRSSPSPSFLSKASPTPSPSFAPPPSRTSTLTLPQTKPSKKRPWSLSLLKFPKKSKLKHPRNEDEESAPAAVVALSNSPRAKSQPFQLPPPPTTTFQLFDSTDEKLPKATRAALKLLYWVFSVAVWALGVGLQLLAAGVVGAGKLISRL